MRKTSEHEHDQALPFNVKFETYHRSPVFASGICYIHTSIEISVMVGLDILYAPHSTHSD